MDLEGSDWKPVTVKLESELMQNENVETDNYLNGSYPKTSHQGHIPFFPECSPVAKGKTDLNLMNNLPLDPHLASSTNLDEQNVLLKIKEEKVEDENADFCSEASRQAPFAIYLEQTPVVPDNNDLSLMSTASTSDVPFVVPYIKEESMEGEDPLADSSLNDLLWNHGKAIQHGPLTNHATFSQEVTSVISESMAMEEPEITNKKSQQFEIAEVLEVNSKGMPHDVTDFLPHTKTKGNLTSTVTPGGESIYQHGDKGAKIYNISFLPLKQCPDQSKVPHADNSSEIRSYTVSSISGNIMLERTVNTPEKRAVVVLSENQFPAYQPAGFNLAVEQGALTDCSTADKKSLIVQMSESDLSLNRRGLIKQYPGKLNDRSKLQSGIGKQTDEECSSSNQLSAQIAENSNLKHLQSHSDKNFSCSECRAQFKYEADLQRHLKTHSDERPFPCNECPAQSKQKAQLQKHSERTHCIKRIFSCRKCSAQFNKKLDLWEHLEYTHLEKRPFTCNECSARFKRKAYLRAHLKLAHSDERPFLCNECSVRFKTKTNLQKHLKYIHSDERPFSCNECFLHFKRKACLQEHLKYTHLGKRRFRCNECSAWFKTKTNLRKHLEYIHSDEGPFPCIECSAQFSQKAHLREHVKRTHSGEWLYLCNECSAQFTRKADFERHFGAHLKIKLTCSKCLAQFKNESVLKSHLLYHSLTFSIFS